MANYPYIMTYKSRPVFVPGTKEKANMGELYSAIVRCHFEDDAATLKTFTFTFSSDTNRFSNTTEYFTDKTVVNNMLSTGQKIFRHFIDGLLREGFLGTFFQVQFERYMPSDGNFKFFGMQLNIIPRPEYDAEFYLGGTAITDPWPLAP
jgi:hypothetical protein